MYYTVTEFAKAVGVSAQTLRIWDRQGILKPHHLSPGGRRMYSEEQLNDYFAESVQRTADGSNTIPVLVTLPKRDLELLKDNLKNVLPALFGERNSYEFYFDSLNLDTEEDVEQHSSVRMTFVRFLLSGKVRKAFVIDFAGILNEKDWFYLKLSAERGLTVLDERYLFFNQKSNSWELNLLREKVG